MTDLATSEIRIPHKGMPPFDESGPAISYFEFWPQHLFYPPMMLYWAWLSLRHGGLTLPTVANPLFPMGGWIGESKSEILGAAGSRARAFIARWCAVRNDPGLSADTAFAAAQMSSISMPFIAKPDMGCRGVGVRRIRTLEELQAYISRYPANETIILQELIDHEAEAGIFYVRRPGEKQGRIISITLKYFPYVYGDGTSTLEQLIRSDRRAGQLAHIYLPRHGTRLNWIVPKGHAFRIAYAGSHSRGTIFRNGNAHVTAEMTRAFDDIARDIPEFHFGRFDVRFTDIGELKRGEGFRIVEINGAGAEATHVWDRNTTLRQAYRDLMAQYRLLWEIGAENARRGFKPVPLRKLLEAYRHETALWAEYPLTD